MLILRLSILLILSVSFFLTGCSGDDGNDGCSSDSECKGDRVCVVGDCVADTANNTQNNANNANNENNANNTNNTTATRDDCVGDYIGNYSGDISGSLSGTMDATGALAIEFSNGNESLDAEGQVTETGTVVAAASIVSIDGSVDFSECKVDGTWQNAAVNASGTWTAVKQ